jgi:hypothetical protein
MALLLHRHHVNNCNLLIVHDIEANITEGQGCSMIVVQLEDLNECFTQLCRVADFLAFSGYCTYGRLTSNRLCRQN